jgi:F0F1-type ATP synthase epsilon subunit
MASSSETFRFSIISPAGLEWEGEVRSVEAENAEGAFSILPDHARFMTILGAVPVVVVTHNEEEQTFTHEQSVLYADNNVVKLYVHEIIDQKTN